MPRTHPEEIKQKALKLRKQGYTYSEIPKILNYSIPKATFSDWFKQITLSEKAKQRILERIKRGGITGLGIAWKATRKKRAQFIKSIYEKVQSEVRDINDLTAKLCLAMLYLGEGGKTGEIFRLGNSDPKVILLFLKLLRKSFKIDKQRLRGVVQCRADQNISELETFWSNVTNIPLKHFYKTMIDKRTVNKPTKKLDYKGVFVVYYHSKALFLEVKFLSDIFYKRLLNKGP